MGACHSKSTTTSGNRVNTYRQAISLSQSRTSSNTPSQLTLENQFQTLLYSKPYDLYLENHLRKTILPESRYLDLALDLILKIEITASDEEKKFAMLVAIYVFLDNSATSRFIKEVNPQLLPTEWREDFQYWEKLCTKSSIADLTPTNFHLKSWKEMLLARDCLDLSSPNYVKALQHYEKALQINPKNAKAVINLFHDLTNNYNPNADLKRAEKLIRDSIALFNNNPIIKLKLKSILASDLYMPKYFEEPSRSNKQKIVSLGFDTEEPYMKEVQGKYIYLITGIDNHRNAWYYILVRPSQEKAFLKALNDEVIHLENYGKILHSAYGDKPPTDIDNALKDEYFIEADGTDMPNALRQLLEENYALTAAQRRPRLTAEGASVNNSKPHARHIPTEAIILGDLLGRGGFATVYKATLDATTTVAVKCYEGLDLPERALAEVLHEIEIMQSLQCVYLVGLVGYNLTPLSPMLVIDYGKNGSLYHLLHSNKTMNWTLRLKIAHDIALGMQYLHNKNYVHRDIKSLNVILFENNRAKLSDFGLSTLKLHSNTSSNAQHANTIAAGSLLWMAPELFVRATSCPSSKSDIWAFGMVMFELASRVLPFHDAQNEEQIKDWIKEGKGENIPAACEQEQPQFAALMKACWRERNQRPVANEIAENPVFNNL